jgi:acid phosphatase
MLGRMGRSYADVYSPFISFDSINRNGTRLAQIQSLEHFRRDVAANTLPQYAHISPDMLNDGHNTTLEYATKWSEEFLTPLLKNKDFMEKTLILLTYDESTTYEIPNKIVSILLGGAIPEDKKGTEDNTFYTHYSIISTLENNWELPCLGRYDVGANLFELVAQQTGYINHPPPNEASVNNSLSYAGALNDVPAQYKPIPPPNLTLIGAGGKPVVENVRRNWGAKKDEPTPYDGSGGVYDGGSNLPVYKVQDVTATPT